MSRVFATIAAARRRALLADLIDRVGRSMAWGAALGLALVLADRLVGLNANWAALLGAPAAIGAAWAAARAWARRPGPLLAAGMLDDALALRDRLTNGLTLAGAHGQDPVFVELAMRESEEVAAAADPRRAIAVRFGRAWHVAPALLALGVAVALVVPSLDLLGREEARRRSTLELARRERVSAQLAAAAEALRPAAMAPDGATPAEPDPRTDELERIREELEQGRISPQDAAARAVLELQAIAERESREADAAASSRRATADALAGLPPPVRSDAPTEIGAPDEVGESALTRAVREGDLAAARDAANELLRPRQPLDAAARSQLAEDLRRLAEDLEQLERQEAEQAARRAAAEARQRGDLTQMQDSGPRAELQTPPESRSESERSGHAAPPVGPQQQRDERAQETSEQGDQQGEPGEQSQLGNREQKPGEQGDRQGKPGEQSPGSERSEGSQALDPEQLQRELERDGMSPEDARRAAEQIAGKSQRDAAQNASRDRRRELAQRLRDAAKSLQPGGSPSEDSQPAPQPDRHPQDTPQPAPQPAAGERPIPEGQPPSPGQQPGPAEQPPSPGQQQTEPQGGQPGSAAQGDASDVPRGASPEQSGQKPTVDQSPSEERGDAGEIPEPTPQALERLAEHLQKMARDGERQRQSAEAARRAREQAEQIARGLNDDQRKRLEQWAEALARQRPDPMEELAGQSPPRDSLDRQPVASDVAGAGEPRAEGVASPAPPGTRRTEIVDARPREGTGRGSDRDQVVAEWLAPPREGDAPSAVAPRERLLEAARSAQKAVDDRAIPARYDRLVQRYFSRLPERVEEAASERPGPSGRTLP